MTCVIVYYVLGPDSSGPRSNHWGAEPQTARGQRHTNPVQQEIVHSFFFICILIFKIRITIIDKKGWIYKLLLKLQF